MSHISKLNPKELILTEVNFINTINHWFSPEIQKIAIWFVKQILELINPETQEDWFGKYDTIKINEVFNQKRIDLINYLKSLINKKEKSQDKYKISFFDKDKEFLSRSLRLMWNNEITIDLIIRWINKELTNEDIITISKGIWKIDIDECRNFIFELAQIKLKSVSLEFFSTLLNNSNFNSYIVSSSDEFKVFLETLIKNENIRWIESVKKLTDAWVKIFFKILIESREITDENKIDVIKYMLKNTSLKEKIEENYWSWITGVYWFLISRDLELKDFEKMWIIIYIDNPDWRNFAFKLLFRTSWLSVIEDISNDADSENELKWIKWKEFIILELREVFWVWVETDIKITEKPKYETHQQEREKYERRILLAKLLWYNSDLTNKDVVISKERVLSSIKNTKEYNWRELIFQLYFWGFYGVIPEYNRFTDELVVKWLINDLGILVNPDFKRIISKFKDKPSCYVNLRFILNNTNIDSLEILLRSEYLLELIKNKNIIEIKEIFAKLPTATDWKLDIKSLRDFLSYNLELIFFIITRFEWVNFWNIKSKYPALLSICSLSEISRTREFTKKIDLFYNVFWMLDWEIWNSKAFYDVLRQSDNIESISFLCEIVWKRENEIMWKEVNSLKVVFTKNNIENPNLDKQRKEENERYLGEFLSIAKWLSFKLSLQEMMLLFENEFIKSWNIVWFLVTIIKHKLWNNGARSIKTESGIEIDLNIINQVRTLCGKDTLKDIWWYRDIHDWSYYWISQKDWTWRVISFDRMILWINNSRVNKERALGTPKSKTGKWWLF